jgi:hypothetical protein
VSSVAPTDTLAVDVVTIKEVETGATVADTTVVDVAKYVPPSPLTATGSFVDRSDQLGVKLPVDLGEKGMRTPYASNGLFHDLDGDGDIDVVFSDGIGELYIGIASAPWTWKVEKVFKVKAPAIYALAVTDVDRDGIAEIFCAGYTVHYLVRQSDGSWNDEAAQRGIVLKGTQSIRGVVPIDLDQDGQLDLAAGAMSCDGSSRVHAWVNQGNGIYKELAMDLGLSHEASMWGLMATDVDSDGWLDLLTFADTCHEVGGSAFLRNLGFKGGEVSFEIKDLEPLFHHKDPSSSPMGGSVGDINNDGHLDYIFSETGMRELRMAGIDVKNPDLELLKQDELAAAHLLIADGKGGFVSNAIEAGIAVPLSATGQTMTSWSMRLFDFDADGHLDIMISHGLDFEAYLMSDEGQMRPVLFRNQGDATFVDVSAIFGLSTKHLSRAMATADVDGDGDLDFFFGGQLHQPLLLENQVKHAGSNLRVRLKGTVSNAWGLGARLKLETSKRTTIAEMTTHSPTETMDEPWVTFALRSDETAKQLQVRWPTGYVQLVDQLDPSKPLVLVEPKFVDVDKTFVHGGQVHFELRAFDEKGLQKTSPQSMSVQAANGDEGIWEEILKCDSAGVCKRMWHAPVGFVGETSFIVKIEGTPLNVRPRVRYAPF